MLVKPHSGPFQAEVHGQAATARIQNFGIDAHAGHQRQVILKSHDGVLVKVGLDQSVACQRRWLPSRGVFSD